MNLFVSFIFLLLSFCLCCLKSGLFFQLPHSRWIYREKKKHRNAAVSMSQSGSMCVLSTLAVCIVLSSQPKKSTALFSQENFSRWQKKKRPTEIKIERSLCNSAKNFKCLSTQLLNSSRYIVWNVRFSFALERLSLFEVWSSFFASEVFCKIVNAIAAFGRKKTLFIRWNTFFGRKKW